MTGVLEQMPVGAQVVLFVLYGCMSAFVGSVAVKRQDAQTRSWKTLVEAQAQALADMQTRIDALQADVLECDRGRAEDRREHAREMANIREQHAREVGDLQGQITMLRHVLKGA